jgi:two-component system nitrate/nitrite response regulator NarL
MPNYKERLNVKKVLLFSSYSILTEGLRMVLEHFGEFSLFVCPSAARLADYSGFCPDIILIDVASGVSHETLKEVRAGVPGAAMVLWVDNVSTEFATQAVNLGVLGIIRKGASVQAHLDCLHKVAAGELCVENDLYLKLVCNKPINLTPRERQLSCLLAQGLKNKEIAYRLGITEGTVKVYLSRLYEKTGAGDRFELALFVLRNLGSDHALPADQMQPASLLARVPSSLPGFLPVGGVAARTH